MRNWIDLFEGASPASVGRDHLMAIADEMGLAVDIAVHDDREISLENLNVPESSRRTGLASRFMQIMCEFCDDHKIVAHVYATPYEGNLEGEELRRFYNGFGFYSEDDGESGYLARRP